MYAARLLAVSSANEIRSAAASTDAVNREALALIIVESSCFLRPSRSFRVARKFMRARVSSLNQCD